MTIPELEAAVASAFADYANTPMAPPTTQADLDAKYAVYADRSCELKLAQGVLERHALAGFVALRGVLRICKNQQMEFPFAQEALAPVEHLLPKE